MTKPARLNLLKKTYKDWKWEKEHRDWIENSYRYDIRREFIQEAGIQNEKGELKNGQ